jgi:hypothetical protein
MDHFQPTWKRAMFVIGVAIICFMLPQDIPLEYCSLNNPSSGLQYLEITCAANFYGLIVISLDSGKGFNNFEAIKWTISPSDSAYTYIFPLADTPLYRLRLSTLQASGALSITNFRIINRRGQEIHRIVKEDFIGLNKTVEIVTTLVGWKVVSIIPGQEHLNDIAIRRPLVPEGMNERNLKRCIISWSYFALMIWILTLAVYFTLRPKGTVHSHASAFLFLAFLALLFSAVGNRGLISNSIRYALIADAAYC